MEFYWQIEQFDGTTVDIPPSAVTTIQKRWDDKQPIHLSSGSIPSNQIKAFRITSRQFGGQPLLESAAQAFKEPLITEDGSIAARWVKKQVTQREWNKHYAGISAYRKLDYDQSMVSVAFILPTHQIDMGKLSYCTAEEVQELTRQ